MDHTLDSLVVITMHLWLHWLTVVRGKQRCWTLYWLRDHDVSIGFVDLRLMAWLSVEEKHVLPRVVDQAIRTVENHSEASSFGCDLDFEKEFATCIITDQQSLLLFVIGQLSFGIQCQSRGPVAITLDLDSEFNAVLQVEVKNVPSLFPGKQNLLHVLVRVYERDVYVDREAIEEHHWRHQTDVICFICLPFLFSEESEQVAVLKVAWLVYLNYLFESIDLPLL